MIPNFKGCFEYNPKSDPLKGLRKEEKDQFAFEYMQMWISEEGFSDFAVMFESGDADLLAHSLVSAGAIDSDTCHASCKMIERRIESWAKTFKNLSHKKQRSRYDVAFKNCMIVTCRTCNHTQFPTQNDYEMYGDTLNKECWECGSSRVEIET